MRILIGLIIFAVGLFIVLKSEWFLRAFGRIAFFEKYFGVDGGSRLGYKLIGILIIFIGTLIMTNLIGGFVGWIFGPLFKYNQ